MESMAELRRSVYDTLIGEWTANIRVHALQARPQETLDVLAIPA
jgi:hypothetical protein